MSWWTQLSLKIRRRETPLFDRLYRIAHAVRSVSVPVIPGLHSFLYNEWEWRVDAWHNFWRIVYYEPMFKSQCCNVGKGFKLYYAGNGTCRIFGSLKISLGDDVVFFDNSSFVGLKVLDGPTLTVGDNTYIGPLNRFMIGKSVTIGKNCIFGSRVMVMDNPGHSTDAHDRMVPGGGSPPRESISPITVGDYCFLGADCFIYPGTCVGDGVVARAGTHLIGRIPPFCIVAGNPGSVRRLLKIPQAMRELDGEERYREWTAAQDAFAAENPSVKREE